MASRRARLIGLSVLTVAVVVAAALGVRALWTAAQAHFSADACTIGSYELDPDQASVAATMVGAVTKHRITAELATERAATLVLGAALQESKLTNIPPGEGDRDSVGVLQQRPSQGWGGGKAAVLTDVSEATKEFLDALVAVPHWPQLPLAEAVQDVQISADGSAYAQHEPEARALAETLLGKKAAGISCSFAKPTKVASTQRVAQLVGDQLGITTPTADARTVRVPGAQWQTAAWFVANADRLGIEQVAYHGKEWTRSDGWKTASASEAVVVATMYQLT